MMNPDNPIHFSEISTFLRCNYLHHLNYNLEIVPRRTASQIAFGTLGHAAMKTLILGGTAEEARKSIDDEIKAEFENDVVGSETNDVKSIGATALEVALRIFPQVKKRFQYKNVMVEEGLRIEVDDILFQGTPDWVAEDEYGVWVIDHKFRSVFRPELSEFVNLQMAFYQGLVLNAKGIETVGSRQLQIKPRLPSEPEILRNGKISKKDIYTDWDTYKAFVISCGQDPMEYIEMRDKLEKHVWFDIDKTMARRDSQEVTNCWNRIIIPAAKAILEAREKDTKPLRCMNWGTCQTCSMFDYCTEDLKDGDLVYLTKTKYKKKDEASFVELQLIDGDEMEMY